MYKVVKAFHDLEDCTTVKGGSICHYYSVGDTYPREGLEPSPERIAELAGRYNRQGVPLIVKVGGIDYESMSKQELIEFGASRGFIVDPKAKKAEIILFLKNSII